MRTHRTSSTNQLRDYSSLFSRSSVKEWMNGNLSSIDFKIERYDKNWYSKANSTYLDYLKFVYSVLEKKYQNEYVFKNSFLNDWLIDELGTSDSKIISEFRLGSAIADLAMFNGNSRAFEIKTELDSDKRLDIQLHHYKKVFNEIYLIVPKTKIKEYKAYDGSVGLISFDSLRPERFQLIRGADVNLEIDSNALMHVFHTKEYKDVVVEHYGHLPKVNSFNQYEVCRDLVNQIPKEQLNKLFVAKMKQRFRKNTLSKRYYKEFNQLSLAIGMDVQSRNQLFSILKTPLNA